MAFVDRQRKSRERNRPAVNFTQRDDVREFAGSGIGRNYNRMMDLQSQKDPNLQDLKQARRQWNRYDKYNAAEMLGRTPMEAQDTFRKDTETFRQGNKPAYNKMYPLTGLAMDYPAKGGLWGMLLSEMAGKTKKGIEDFGDYIGSGITSALAGDSEKDKAEYVAKTFGPYLQDYPTDIHPGLPMDEEPLLVDEEPGLTRREQIEKVIKDPGIRTDAEFLLTPSETEDELRREQLLKEAEENMVLSNVPEDVEPLPFDEGREDYIAELGMNPNLLRQEKLREMGEIPRNLINPPLSPHGDLYADPGISVEFGDDEVPAPLSPYQGREFGLEQFRNRMPRDWQDYLEDLERVGDMPGGHLTYEEWHDAMRRRR